MRAGKHLAKKVAKAKQVAIEEHQVANEKEMIFALRNVHRGLSL